MHDRLLSMFLFCLAVLVVESEGHTSAATSTNAVTSSFSSCRKTTPSTSAAFGISNAIANLRGGEVIEGSTASDVDALILKAGSSQSLVVIDFSATWW